MLNPLTSLLLGAALAAPEPAADREKALDQEAVTAVRAALEPIAERLELAARGDAEAKQALGREATDPLAGSQLDAWVAGARQVEGAADVKLVGFEVQATLWFGIVPLQQVELYYWLTDDGARVLRMTMGERQLPVFGVPDARWSGTAGEGLERLVSQVLGAARERQCDTLPVVTTEDYQAALPAGERAAKATISYLDRFRREVRGTCQGLAGVPYNHVTWRVTDIGGVVKAEQAQGASRSFRMLVEQRPDGALGLERISTPVAPKER